MFVKVSQVCYDFSAGSDNMLTQKPSEKLFQSVTPINAARGEFSRHIASRLGGEFQLSRSASDELSKLLRSLESKRLTGKALTDEEHMLLQDGDKLFQDIARFNEQVKAQPLPGPTVYDLSQSRKVPEDPASAPVIIPRISEEEADRIIAGFNKQFEEKIMNKIRESHQGAPESEPKPLVTKAPESVEHGSASDDAQAKAQRGRSLQEYLGTIQEPQHTVPFADEDSGFELSKLVKNNSGEHV